MKSKVFKNRFSIAIALFLGFILISSILRVILILWQIKEVDLNIFTLGKTILTGIFYDIGTASFVFMPLTIYLTVIPKKIIGSYIDKSIVYFISLITVFILIFTFFAEITFWEEFRTRFNFIAVDYLIYTNEVISNIQQSYPLPILISGIISLCFVVFYLLRKLDAFRNTYTYKLPLNGRILFLIGNLMIALFFTKFITNQQAEWSTNRYNNEISKSGIYSFFAAFRNNQLEYKTFYKTIENEKAFSILKKHLQINSNSDTQLLRQISKTQNLEKEQRPNVVLVMMESMSASFMKEYGSKLNITPNLDSIAQKGISFTNLMATGNRTVRGIEALTLSIPPTPGQSIVKRPNNDNLFTIANVFKTKGYTNTFFYGGDGYFDNMNTYFSGNNFNIFDRSHSKILNENLETNRTNITDEQVTFENAWGICDEDIYNIVLNQCDVMYKNKQPFFNYILTTSNHRPYTYPKNKIDIPSGTGRDGAVKYADYAIGQFLKKASKKEWFKNTVFIFVADHCASSAGKNEIDVENYHIPAIIYNLPNQMPFKENKLMSQIDILPTLFGKLNWNYNSKFYGQDINSKTYSERALMATYRKLSYLNNKNEVIILSDQKKYAQYIWDKNSNNLISKPINSNLLQETISWYQTADYLFTNNLLKN